MQIAPLTVTTTTTIITTTLLSGTTTTPTVPDAHRDRGSTVEGDGRQKKPGSVTLARFNYMLLRACDWTTRQV